MIKHNKIDELKYYKLEGLEIEAIDVIESVLGRWVQSILQGKCLEIRDASRQEKWS